MEIKWLELADLEALPEEIKKDFVSFSRPPKSNPSGLWLMAFEKGHPIGIATLFNAKGFSNINVEFLEVLPKHTAKGIASSLMEGIFTYASEHGKIVTSNGFTDDGQKYLVPLMQRLAKKYGQEEIVVIGRC